MSREVKSFDSLDAFLFYKVQQWEADHPRPDAPDHLQKSPTEPKSFILVSDKELGYIGASPRSGHHIEIKAHVLKNSKTVSLMLTSSQLEDLIEQLLTLQCDMNAFHEWTTHNDAQALHQWKTRRGQLIGDWKREFQQETETEHAHANS